MKKFIIIFFLSIVCYLHGRCQSDSTSQHAWEFSTDINFYFIPDDFFMLPVVRADKDKLHLEFRYNYEERETFSAWAGYNIIGGNNLEYIITPMVGFVNGLTDGIAPGLELTFEYKKLVLYSENEYLFDFYSEENNFFYCWTDLEYYPKESIWVGLSGQRTRLYQTDLDIQRGLFVGGSFKRIDMTGYVYNVFSDEAFVLITLSVNF